MDTEIQTTKDIKQKKKIDEFVIDETHLKIGSQCIWIWIAIEPKHKQILHIDISFERTMLIAKRFIASLIDKYDKHPLFQQRWWHLVSPSL